MSREEILTRMCEGYCKYPDIWDEDKEGIPLSDSDACRNCPLNELEEQKPGSWIGMEVYGHKTWECSSCGWEVYSEDNLTNFCPSCGTRMEATK